MATISLTRGFEAIVDDTDFDWINQWKWSALVCGQKRRLVYAYRMEGPRGKSRGVMMHRQLIGTSIEYLVDHHDGNTLNNRRSNLRACSKSENNANNWRAPGITGFRGVTINPNNSSRFTAQISGVGYLGSFPTAEDAARAYDAAAIQHFGEFARPNFPRGLHEP